MMKSFFKKLAFVMALAMVVTMAAPAGTSALAAGLYIADEANKKAETFKLEIGEKEDFSFKGAPANWKDDYKWTSSDTSVATVDQSGLVTGKADGVATITINVLGESATVEVTVGKGATKPATNGAYTVKQTTATEIEVYFDEKPAFKADEIQLEFILDAEAGYKTKWPIEAVTEIENGYKIKPYVDFSNGDTYLIKFGAEDEGTTFQTIFGAPDRIEVVYSSNGDEGHAYMSVVNDTTTEYVPVVLDVKFFSGDVDVTSKYEETKASSVLYDFALNTDVDNVFIGSVTVADTVNGYEVGDPALFMTKAGAGAVVRATYTGMDSNYEYYTLVDDTEVIYPEKMPEYTIRGVVNWTIVDNSFKSEPLDWTKPVQDLSAFDEDRTGLGGTKIVVLVQDSEGNFFVSDNRFIDPDNKIYGDLTEMNGKYGKFAQKGYSIKFASSDTSKLLAGTDGSLTTYVPADVPVLVALYNTNNMTETNINGFVKYIGAPVVEVTAKRAVKSMAPDARAYTVLTNANDDSYTQGEIKLTIKDQHGDAWWNDALVTVTTNVDGLELINEAAGVNGVANTVAYNTTDKEAVIAIDGRALYEQLPATRKASAVNTVILTFKATKDNATATTTATLYLKKPVTTVVNSQEVITINRWQLTANAVDQKVTEDEDIPAVSTIKLNEFNNSLAVGNMQGIHLYNKSVASAEGDGYTFNENTTTGVYVTANSYWLQVYDSNNVLVPVTASRNETGVYANPDGTFDLIAAAVNPETGKISYITPGTYTAKVVKATYVYDTNQTVTDLSFNTQAANYSTTIKVENTNSHVQFVKIKTDKTQTSATTAKAIVVDTLEFNLNGSKWEFTEADIESVTVKHNPKAGSNAGYVIITDVTFKVPVDGGYNADKNTNTEDQDYYYLDKVTVNRAIELLGQYSGQQ